MRHALFVVLMAVNCLPTASAGDLSTVDLIRRLTGIGNSDARAEYFAKGYLDGLLDATEGRLWCEPAMRPSDHEFDIELLHNLSRQPTYASSLADVAVTSHLSKQYPCASALPHPKSIRLTPGALHRAVAPVKGYPHTANLHAMSTGYIAAVVDVSKLSGGRHASPVDQNRLQQTLRDHVPASRQNWSAADWILTVMADRPHAKGD